MTRTRAAVTVGLILLAIAAGVDLTRLHGAAPWRNMIDLPVFYCAGSAVVQRRDPYALEPVRSCEHRLNRGVAWENPAYVMPAPVPPYAFPPYAVLSTIDYRAAKAVIGVSIAAAVFVAALALADLGIPFAAALAALALADGYVGVFLGQIYPFTIALLALAAASLRRERYALAGVFAALTLVQPQIGIPICLSSFLWAPRTRLSLAASGCVLGVAGLAAVGPHGFLEWATRVIPEQARNEVFFWGQYSLTSVLAALGVGAGTALAAGSLSFVVMLVVATWLAKRLADALHAREYVVLVPPALCVIGGSYVHVASIAAAIPLALALAQSAPAARAGWRVVVPLILLAIPWPFAQAVKALFFSCLLVSAVVVVALRVTAREAIALLAATAAGLYAIALHTPAAVPLEAVAGSVDPFREIAKLPTWAGLLWLLVLTLCIGIPRHSAGADAPGSTGVA